MNSKKETRFHFKFGEVEIEIEGAPDFVNRMYQKVLSDVERARRFENLPWESQELLVEEEVSVSKRIIWVHKCSTMMNKIYMATTEEIGEQDILHLVDLRGIGVIYADRRVISLVLPNHREGQTLWAELTSRGRNEIQRSKED